MSDFLEVNQANFQSSVLESPQPVIAEFGADWCRPCKTLEPVLKQLGEEWSGKVTMAHVDVDNDPDLATKFNIFGVPTVILFIDGREVDRFTGYQPKERIVARFAPHLQLG